MVHACKHIKDQFAGEDEPDEKVEGQETELDQTPL